MKKYVLSLVVLSSWLNSSHCMIVPVSQGVSFTGRTAFDVNFSDYNNKVYGEEKGDSVNRSAGFWTEEESSDDTSNDSGNYVNLNLGSYLRREVDSKQKGSESWNVSNGNDFWIEEKSNEPVKYEQLWNSSLKSFDYPELLDGQNGRIIRSNSGINVFEQNEGRNSTNALIRFNRGEISHDENQRASDLISEFKPKENCEDFPKMASGTHSTAAYNTVASISVCMRLVGRVLKKVCAKALSGWASLIRFGSKVGFSAVSAPVVFVGLKILGVDTIKSLGTAGAWAVSPFVISPIRTIGKSIGFASCLRIGRIPNIFSRC